MQLIYRMNHVDTLCIHNNGNKCWLLIQTKKFQMTQYIFTKRSRNMSLRT